MCVLFFSTNLIIVLEINRKSYALHFYAFPCNILIITVVKHKQIWEDLEKVKLKNNKINDKN